MAQAELRARLFDTLGVQLEVGQAVIVKCPVCGSREDVRVAIRDRAAPTYLFDLMCFCHCDEQKVADALLQRAAPASRSTMIRRRDKLGRFRRERLTCRDLPQHNDREF
jgi:hypothetical protein